MTCAIRIPDLDVLLGGVWQGLTEAALMRSHPFRHPSLCTVDGAGLPQARRVVLREASALTRVLGVHSDARSAKVAELRARPAAAFLFWDAGRRWQVRAHTRVDLHHADDVTAAAIASTPPASLSFLGVDSPPSSPLALPGEGNTSPVTAELALERLVVIRAVVQSLDVLQLHDDGPLRAWFSWQQGGELQASWRVP